MHPPRLYRWMLAGTLFAGGFTPVAAIQVVGDSACGYYDVDIASFATCVDGRVVKPDTATAPPRTALPAPSPRPWEEGRGEGARPRDANAKPGAANVRATPTTLARPGAGGAAPRPAAQPR